MTRAEEIIDYAVQLRNAFGTNNPFKIAQYYGIEVRDNLSCNSFRAAYTVKAEGYPTIICIENGISRVGKKLLCAHELGHALLHNDGYNAYDVKGRNKYTQVEYDANMFALALMTRGAELNRIRNMTPYEVKSHLDKYISNSND